MAVLSGELPLTMIHLDLEHLTFNDTHLCEPSDVDFQAWLDGIPYLRRTNVVCGGGATPTATPTRLPYTALLPLTAKHHSG